MKVRILREQDKTPESPYMASGSIQELPAQKAKDLINAGHAEPADAKPPAQRSEKR